MKVLGEKFGAALMITSTIVLSSFSGHAIEKLTIAVENNDVVLRWPSEIGAVYIVQYRATLSPETPWTMLSTNHPADSGEITTFIHEDVFTCPPVSGGGGSGGGGPPPPPGGQSLISSDGATSSVPLWERWKVEGREPYAWEVEQRPPFPWEAAAWNSAYGSGTQDFMEMESMSGGAASAQSAPCIGFYKVVKDGVRLWSMTNGFFLSGITNILVEAGNPIGTLQSVSLTANSASIPGTEMLAAPFSSPLTFAFDTRMLANGTYSLAASATWLVLMSNTVESPFIDKVSAPVSVTLSNMIFYPDWVQEYGNDLLIININLAVQSAHWFVDIWDSDGEYLGYFEDDTDNGVINFSWDMKDGNGIKIDSPIFYTATEIVPAGNPSGAVTQNNPLLISVTDDYPWEGWWAGALQDFLPHQLTGYAEWKERVDSMAGVAEQNYGLLPNDNRTPGELHVIRVGPQWGNTDWTPFWLSMTNHHVRNVYYWGHGSQNWLGDTHGGFSQPFLQNVLGNTFTSTNKHRFRFVWLDGCDTARGDWPHAFALGKRENVPLTQYSSRPGLYCGFTDKTLAAHIVKNEHGQIVGGSIPDNVGFFRSNFAFYWSLTPRGAYDAFNQARIDSGAHDDWSKLKLYGYRDMFYGQFNHQIDWPIPR